MADLRICLAGMHPLAIPAEPARNEMQMTADEAIAHMKLGLTLTDGVFYYSINNEIMWRTCGDPNCCMDDFEESQMREVIDGVINHLKIYK